MTLWRKGPESDTVAEMPKVPGHTILEVLWTDSSFFVARGKNDRDGGTLLIAGPDVGVCRKENNLNLEADLQLMRIASEGELEPIGVSQEGCLFAVLKKRDVLSLEDFLNRPARAPGDAIGLCCKLAQFLTVAHEQGTVVDRWPQGVFVESEGNNVICFPRCGEALPRAKQPLQYLAPEHLVASHAAHDIGADLYCLGVSCYRALLGRYPFSQNGSELLHAHLALTPTAPHDVDSSIPKSLSSVVEALLAKSPDTRYRTAASALADLKQCRRELRGKLAPAPFKAGVLEVHARMDELPLCGREQEQALFAEVWERTRLNEVNAIFVSGPPGIGKSCLAEAFRTTIGEQFRSASGKFDQVHIGLASSGLMGALKSLVNALLSEDPKNLEASRHSLNVALGRSARVLVELLPELSRLVEVEVATPLLPAEQAKNRLEHAFVQLVTAVASTRPLVLLIDDFQWCDDASARLLGALLLRARDCPLLIVATHRPVVEDSHPLNLLVKKLRGQLGKTFTEVRLGALSVPALELIVQTALRAPVDKRAQLAELLGKKAAGNPLYFARLLRHVYDTGLLHFDEKRQCWSPDWGRLQSLDVTDNVVDFLVTQLQRLTPIERELCQLAACLGSSFKLDVLSGITLMSPVAVRGILAQLCEKHLIAPEIVRENRVVLLDHYRFQHDRIHQATYETLSAQDRKSLHSRIGLYLLKGRDETEVDEELFLIVGHFNRKLVGTNNTHLDMRRRLNLRAGQKALQSTAHEAAVEYLESAADNLSESVWDFAPQFALTLTRCRATAMYLTGQTKTAERLLLLALSKTQNMTERSDLYAIYLTVLGLVARYTDALKLAGEALREFDATLPAAVDVKLNSYDLEQITKLVDVEPMQDPHALAVAQILASMLPVTFLGDPSLFPAVVVSSVQLALEHGPTAESAGAVACFGILLAAGGDTRAAFRCGHSAISLARRFKDLSQLCKTEEIFIGCIAHWTTPLRDSEAIAEEAYQAGIDSGDLQFAAYVRMHDTLNRFHAGHSLPALRAYCQEAAKLPARTGDKVSGNCLAGILLILNELIEGGHECLDNDEELHATWRAEGGELSWYFYLVMKAEVLYRRGHIEKSMLALEQAEPVLPLAPGVISNAVHVFIRALAATRLAASASAERRAELLAIARSDRELLSHWAINCRENYHHKLRLAEAELHCVNNEPLLALQAYNDAIFDAAASEFVQDELLAVERCMVLCAHLGLTVQLGELQIRAERLRTQWGEGRAGRLQAKSVSSNAVAEGFAYASPATLLGFTAAIEAAQTLTESLQLEEVLRSFVATARKHCGAERAVLLLLEGENLSVVESQPALSPDKGLTLGETVPAQVVQFVARTAKPVERKPGPVAAQFDLDPYLRRHRPAALIAVPVVHGAVVLGVLYLENRHASTVFSGGARRFLEVLGSRAAIALENARLFMGLTREVEQRRETEAQLKASLEEKGLLLQEIHHRVNNNLQLISSLLNLQRDRCASKSALQVLAASRGRIQAMALIHNRLHSTQLVSTLEFPRYIRELAAQGRSAHNANVEFEFELCDSLLLNVSQAIPLGLLVNELLSNAFTHAFPDGKVGLIRIALRRLDNDYAEFLMTDNGLGMQVPAPERAHLGLKISAALALQLGGRLEANTDREVSYRLKFKLLSSVVAGVKNSALMY